MDPERSPVKKRIPKQAVLFWLILAFLSVAFSIGCGFESNGGGSEAISFSGVGLDDDGADDDTTDDDTTDDDATDDDTTDDDTADDDTADDDTADDDDDTQDPLLPFPPDDGRIWAAAGHAVITPDEINHPEPIYLGGTGQNRIAEGVHDDLFAKILILAQGGEHAVLCSLDLVGFPSSRIRFIREGLAAFGLSPDKIFVSSTHTHEGPDTMGIWGPDPFTTGASPAYAQFIVDTVVDLVLEIWMDLVPVTMSAAQCPIDEPGSNYPKLIRDARHPRIPYPSLSAARFESDAGLTVATFVNWHNHPEVTISTRLISSDFPQWVRLRLEDVLGGEAAYFSGAVGGLATPLGVDVTAFDEEGNRILDEFGDPVFLLDQSFEKSRSLGFAIAEYVLEGLDAAETEEEAALSVSTLELAIPLHNPRLWLAFQARILDYGPEDRVWEPFPTCLPFGCIRAWIGIIRVGPLAIVTSPGETFSETILGRPETTVDYGGDWGEFTFPAMEGYLAHLDARVPAHLGLCGDEIGYIVPVSDMHPLDHPDNYEETLCLGFTTESLYREGVIELATGGD